MSNRLVTYATLVLVVGCHQPMRTAHVQAGYLHPMLAASSPASREELIESPLIGDNDTAPTPALPVGDADPGRIRVVESVRRLLGVRRSFDDRSFLGHVLRINDMLPGGAISRSYSTDLYLKVAKSEGRVRGGEEARPGDVVLFRCPERCGVSAADGIGAGFIERVVDGGIEFIAYVGGVVRRCFHGKKDPGPGYMVIDKVVAIVALAR